ncbi:MAG: glycoside hydrolase family 9 protein [Deltaproteobacteria bacterium]|nr:glycoside hydrolase family 9 protein [Deltaproteobacteria bacterium]
MQSIRFLISLFIFTFLTGLGCSEKSSSKNDTENDSSLTDSDTDSTKTDSASDTSAKDSETDSTDSDSTVAASYDATNFIVVDQFGYRPEDQKVAVVRDPQIGFDGNETFTPGANYQLVDAKNGSSVFEGSLTVWNSGQTDSYSGDKAWWFDFSSVKTPGTYFVLDKDNSVRSAVFEIDKDVYKEVLKAAVKTMYYQRAGFEKEAKYATEAYADGASHVGPLQDTHCRIYNDPDNAATERDLSGGWYDAGDFNKYTAWTASYIISMLRSYSENPAPFTDDYNIPESGNGIPDILDEAKWGMDHLIKLQNADGSLLSVVGLAGGSPPSSATGQSLYGSESTSATLSGAAAYAYASKVFCSKASFGLDTYCSDLKTRAINAWDYADANPAVIFKNNDNDSGTKGLASGQQETDDYGRLVRKVEAAVYLFEITGDTKYRDFVDANYETVHMMEWNYVFPYEYENQDTLMYYSSLKDATSSVAADIKATYIAALDKDDNFPAYTGKQDPYMSYLDSYTWGSNNTKSKQGLNLYANITYTLDNTKDGDAQNGAEGYIHYIHGVNPLNLVYLSNMYDLGGDNCVNQFYHTWFADGSPLWDEVGVSTYGPPPGFLTGGANPGYKKDSCCQEGNSCGSTGNDALCNAISVEPPLNQPPAKSYLDFNNNWPLNSWAVTENSDGYQLSYIRLLSKFVN